MKRQTLIEELSLAGEWAEELTRSPDHDNVELYVRPDGILVEVEREKPGETRSRASTVTWEDLRAMGAGAIRQRAAYLSATLED